jgi:hypothetical protein
MENEKVESVLRYLCDTLGGDWLLAGGSLVRLIFDARRGTEDIDLARVAHPVLSEESALNRLYVHVRSLGLGPEHVNPAFQAFLRQVPDWMGELVLLREGARGRIYRPSLTLFAYLKLLRGTPIDVEDVRSAVACLGPGEFMESRFRAWAAPEIQERFERHRAAIGL